MNTEITVLAHGAASASFASHHGLSLPAAGARLTVGDSFAKGGFGTIHEVHQIDGRPPVRPLVAKLFDAGKLADGGRSEIDSMRALHDALAANGGAGWPDGVRALIYALFPSEVKGRKTIVGLMLNLRTLGYEDAPFASGGDFKRYQALTMPQRIELATKFAERAELLERIRFVHGDINPENLQVDLSGLDVQIIDFDAGVIAATGGEHPRTPGKPDGCMPPEVKGTGVGANYFLDRFTMEAERWSIGVVMGYCLFGYEPTFFFRTISQRVVEEYSKGQLRWPDIDTAGPLFTQEQQNKRLYPQLRRSLAALPEGGRECFQDLFAAGLDGRRRPTAAGWLAGLTSLKAPPRIDDFTVNETIVFEGSVVELTWNVANAAHVELTPGLPGQHPAVGSAKVVLDSSTIFEIRAVNDFDACTTDPLVVQVLPLPRLSIVPVPTAPNLTFPTSIPVVALGPGGTAGWLPDLHAALSTVGAGAPSPVPAAPQITALLRSGPLSSPLPGAPDVRDLLTSTRTGNG